jgi:cytoskeletal protein RodZ
MDSEHILAAILIFLILSTIVSAAILIGYLILAPSWNQKTQDNPIPETTTTTTSTTSSTSSTTASTSSTATTSTTLPHPYHICEKEIVQDGLIETLCQRKPTSSTPQGQTPAWESNKLNSKVRYALQNADGGHDSQYAKVSGSTCHYLSTEIMEMKFSHLLSCVKPSNLSLQKEAILHTP